MMLHLPVLQLSSAATGLAELSGRAFVSRSKVPFLGNQDCCMELAHLPLRVEASMKSYVLL